VPTLPIETIAIVEATAPDVRAKAAAITFRMWHRLPSEAARRLLFAEFVVDGAVVGLLEAVAITARRGWPQAFPRLVTPDVLQEAASVYASIEPALLIALQEVLGGIATNPVINAWQAAFRFLIGRIET
jgi:hemoglobin-like flavoprotein